MSQYLAQARTALRKVENDELLDEPEVAITVFALKWIIREGRTPFQRFRNYYIIGTERFPVLNGLDYLRTIIMHQKNTTRHPGTNLSEISAFEVHAASQVEPPQAYNYDSEGATADEYALDLLGFDQGSNVGPDGGSSLQRVLDHKAIASLSQYAKELKANDSIAAVEKAQELENWLRQQTPDAEKVRQGDLEGIVEAHNRKHFFYGTPRTFRKPSQNIADKVRNSVNYALAALRKNPLTVDIADHLERHCWIGQTCEYTGDWKWLFVKNFENN